MAGRRGRPAPPRWMRRILGWVLPRRDRRHLLGEMERLYRWRLERDGSARARLWYARQVLFFPVRLMAEAVRSAPERLAGAAAGIVWDIRYSIRRLRRRPSYVWTAVLTLGVAVGGVASVYNAANWVLLRPVPGVGDRSELVTIRLEMGGPSSPAFPISAPDLAELADGTEALRGLAGGFEVNVNLLPVRGGEPRRVTASVVTTNYFAVLRSSPARGRFFDEAIGATDRVAVVSHRLWRSVWGGFAK